ncbi:MAG TPA: hypothetical protein VFE51_04200 [Verrucomicrobiae bacterium]|nr:hypothetical protein [Verrucomicrobiae bacterium]
MFATMTPVRRAVIDVGTNSVKLLVAEVDERQVQPLLEQSKQTRLGRGFYPEHVLQAGPITQTAQAVAEFADQARQHGATKVQVVATSAARDARNQRELLSAIEAACGLPVRVLTGEQEADYGFQGVTSDPRLAHESLLLLDVGGGSSEFIVGRDGEKHLAHSFDLGTVRLLEQLHQDDPPTDEQLRDCRARLLDFLEAEVGPKVWPALQRESSGREDDGSIQFVGLGGTASVLGCIEGGLRGFDRERLEATRLSPERLHWHVQHLWGLSLAQRKTVPGLPPNRADVILTGAAIFESVMGFFGFRQLRVSTRGLRFALAMEP